MKESQDMEQWALESGLTETELRDLKRHQAKCMEALACLEQLRKEQGLGYCLLAGSVLGAVRHGGFIPWDDDIDVGVPAQEMEAFEQTVKESLPLGFTLEQPRENHPYPRMFSKICYGGRCCIDLWPLVPTYEKGIGALFTWYFEKIISKVHFLKIGCPVKKLRPVAQLCGLFLTDKKALRLARWNERKFAKRRYTAYVNLYSIYSRKKETLLREWLENTEIADFAGLQVPVVGYTHQYLTHLYGDYMVLPPTEKRVSRHYEIFGPYGQ